MTTNCIPESQSFAYISIITTDAFFPGLKVMIRSLKRTKPKYPIIVLMPEHSDLTLQKKVSRLGVTVLLSKSITISSEKADTNKVSHWNETFFKLNLMRLTQFKKILYLDCDMIVLNNLDHLFLYPSISATTGGKSAHPEWDEFNSGIMVLEPSYNNFRSLIQCIEPAIERKKSLGAGYGDQDVFNEFYPQWKNMPAHHFSETYNSITIFIDELMAREGFTKLKQLNVIHYIGTKKIWSYSLLSKLRLIRACLLSKRKYEAYSYLLFMWRSIV